MAVRAIRVLCTACLLVSSGALWAQTAADCDFDGSGTVDFADFLGFVAAYGTGQVGFDLNGSGTVDFPDFLTLVRFYGQSAHQANSLETTVDLPGGVQMVFVRVMPGRFVMGSILAEVGHEEDEGPRRTVAISNAYDLGKYEVTQAQWLAAMGTAPWSGRPFVREDPDNPAVYLSWEDAAAFAARLNELAGEELYRLPTEAEWEYACRAGTRTTWSFGDEESLLGTFGWYYDNAASAGEAYAHRVGTKRPNPWGLHDMHGNVWEWVQDWYGVYSSAQQTDPAGPGEGLVRVVRSGDFNYLATGTRSASRNFSLSTSDAYTGFRVLRVVR